MYTVKGDDTVIYSDIQTTESRKASSVKLTLKDNAAGSLEITLPPGNAGYDALKRMTSEIVVYRDKEEMWSGRILSEQMDFWNNRVLTCEGELSYLNDSIQPQKKYEKGTTVGVFIEALLENHNAKYTDERYKFYMDRAVATVVNYDKELPEITTDYCTTLDAITTNITDELDCHILVVKSDGKKYIKIVTNEATFNENTQVIRFGQNLLDFTKNWDLSDIGTVLIPKGAALDTESDDGFTTYVTLSDIPLDSEVAKSDTGYYKRTCNTCSSEDEPAYLEYDEKTTGGIRYYYCPTCKKWFTNSSTLADNTTLVHEDTDDPTSDLVYVYYDKTDDDGNLVYKYEKDDDGYITLETTTITIDGTSVEKPLIRVNTNKSTETTTVVEYLEYDSDGNGEVTCKIETDKTYADVLMKAESTDDSDDDNAEFYSLKDKYGRVEQVVNFSDAEDSVALIKEVFEYIKDNRFDRMTLSISAVDMRYLTGSAEPIRILDRVRCISRPHGMNTLFTVTELTIDLDKPDSAEYTLEKTISGTSSASNTISGEISVATAVLDPQSPSSILQNAKSTASRILQEHINGYVTLVTDTEGGRHSESLVISSSKDYKRSENFWVWNLNGLGHYTEDYDGDAATSSTGEDVTDFWNNGNKYELNMGITMDGAIVANRITVGQMSADRVRTGVLMSQDGNVFWNLNADDLTGYSYTDADGTVHYVGDIPGGSMIIKKGSITLGENNEFSVTEAGYLTAVSGTIGGFTISEDSLSNNGMTLGESGLTFTYIDNDTTKDVGNIGTSEWENDGNAKILAMNLDNTGAAIIWGLWSNSQKSYDAKFVYANKAYENYAKDHFYMHAPLNMNGNSITNCDLNMSKGTISINGYTGATGTFTDGNGNTITVKKGIITSL